MAFESLVHEIDAEIRRLQQAKALLSGTRNGNVGRPAQVAQSTPAAAPKRVLSPKARKAIADAQKKRWAKIKAQKKA